MISGVGVGVRVLKWVFPEASDTLDTVHGMYRTWRAVVAVKQLGNDGDDDGAQDAE